MALVKTFYFHALNNLMKLNFIFFLFIVIWKKFEVKRKEMEENHLQFNVYQNLKQKNNDQNESNLLQMIVMNFAWNCPIELLLIASCDNHKLLNLSYKIIFFKISCIFLKVIPTLFYFYQAPVMKLLSSKSEYFPFRKSIWVIMKVAHWQCSVSDKINVHIFN